MAEFMQESILFSIVRVQCRRKASSRSLSHLLMSFLFEFGLGPSLRYTVDWALLDRLETEKSYDI